MRRNCPNCGSEHIYNHDKGWNYFLRVLNRSSRFVCEMCNSTWRRNTPNQISRLKNKKVVKKVKGVEYVIKSWKVAKKHNTEDEILELVNRWKNQDKRFICFDFSRIDKLELDDRSRLVKLSRKLNSISGDLVVTRPSEQIFNELVSFNLGFLVAGSHKIKGK